MKRKIVVNGAILQRSISGIPRATTHLMEALGELPDTSVTAVAPTRRRSRSSLVNAVQDTWWDLRGAECAAGQADLLVSPCNIGRAGQIPNLLVVYDIMPLEHPEYFDKKFAAYYRHFMPYALRRATRTITNSEHVRGKLLALAPDADVRVIPLPGSRLAKVQVAFPLQRRNILMVGATEPHKNQVGGVEAVRILRRMSGEDLQLHLVGPSGRAEQEVAAAIRRADPSGAWITRHVAVSDIELEQLYASAWILLQPSINEGYGLPLVEAAERGLPAIHSGAGAMAEVSPQGNAGSADAGTLALAMASLLEATAWERHVASNREAAQQRSWGAFCSRVQNVVEPLLPSATRTRVSS